jgi:flagella basal body P-ring formation protein FlgA
MSWRAISRHSGMLLIFLLFGAPSATAEKMAAMFVVPTTTVRAGEMLTEEKLGERRLLGNEVALRTHFTSRDAVVGKVALRTLQAGAAIAITAVGEPQAFREGDRAILEFTSGGLSIRSIGLAQQAGIPGRSIRIRNLDTGLIVTGVVRHDGIVEVGGR